nr:ribonuclease H-like domain-containing protein [Tanacetum cinerariifolium]
MVRFMWLFKHKFHADGTLSRYKACLVANKSSQQLGVDFDETFSPVVKPATIRTVLILVVSRKWSIHQLDVTNAFLNGDLSETGSHVAYLLLYADDIILTASSTALLQHLIDSLHREFDMTDLETLNYFLGIFVVHHSTVQQIFLYMPDSREPHLAALKRILRYVQDTLDFGLHLCASSTTSLVGYNDADWAVCPSTRRSTLETAWLRNLLCELHSPQSTATLDFYDNLSAIYMSANLVQHQRTKHIEIDIHLVYDMVTAGQHMVGNFSKLDKFEGVDFRRWLKKMHFHLSTMSVVYVITTPMPEDGENATVEQIRKMSKWENDDYVCRGIILNDFKRTLKHKKEELTFIELGNHLHIEALLKVQASDKPNGNNIFGLSVVNMMEHNNSIRMMMLHGGLTQEQLGVSNGLTRPDPKLIRVTRIQILWFLFSVIVGCCYVDWVDGWSSARISCLSNLHACIVTE